MIRRDRCGGSQRLGRSQPREGASSIIQKLPRVPTALRPTRTPCDSKAHPHGLRAPSSSEPHAQAPCIPHHPRPLAITHVTHGRHATTPPSSIHTTSHHSHTMRGRVCLCKSRMQRGRAPPAGLPPPDLLLRLSLLVQRRRPTCIVLSASSLCRWLPTERLLRATQLCCPAGSPLLRPTPPLPPLARPRPNPTVAARYRRPWCRPPGPSHRMTSRWPQASTRRRR